MNQYRTLTKTFISAISMSKPQDRRRKIMILILSVFAILGVLLPVSIGIGLLIHLMTKTLIGIGQEAIGLEFMFHVICLFTMVFGLNVIFNEFYFSNDIEFLLPWPLRAYQIVGAKFTAAYYNENMMQFILVLACIIGYGTAYPMHIGQWLLSLIGVITLPILPLVYCALFAMIIMAFTHLVRSKELIQRLSILLFFAILVVLVASIGFLQDMDIDTYISSLVAGNNRFLNVMNICFPHIPMYITAVHDGSVFALLKYLFINLIAIVAVIGVSELLYFRGITELSTNQNKKRNRTFEQLLHSCKQRNVFISYMKKELLILLRTPVFFTNCIAITFVWPIFIYAILKIQSQEITLNSLQNLYLHRDFRIQLILLLGIIGISVIVTALSSLSSNAISREGKHFSFMKYIPVSYSTQWHAKALIGVIIPFLGIQIYFIPACILLRIPILHILIYVTLSFLAILFTSYLGIYIDSIQPKLIWDDELSALRENYNTFFSMAIAIGYALFTCVGGFFLFCNTKTSIGFMWILLLCILAGSNCILFYFTKRSMNRNIEEQEET